MRIVGRSPLGSGSVFGTCELLFIIDIIAVEFAAPPPMPEALLERGLRVVNKINQYQYHLQLVLKEEESTHRKVDGVDRRVACEEEGIVDERSNERTHDRRDDTRPQPVLTTNKNNELNARDARQTPEEEKLTA